MIYIATVHWNSDRWIKVQRDYLQKFIDMPFQVFAFISGVSVEWDTYFDYSTHRDDLTHAEKLDDLAKRIILQSNSDSDILIFLDGDAFPIAPLTKKVKEYLSIFPLVAVKRIENRGDIQPHPCFCATTVGFWKKYHPSWREGYTWMNEIGLPTTDVGAGVLEALENHSLEWKPLLRTNAQNLHPVLFGIYDYLIYHHGAGFRDAFVRKDARAQSPLGVNDWTKDLYRQMIPMRLRQLISNSFLNPVWRSRRRLIRENNALSNMLYQALTDNPDQLFRILNRGEHQHASE